MKTCPKCQQQYPNGFQYCPNDTELLVSNEEQVRRTVPLTSTSTTEAIESAEVVPITIPLSNEKSDPMEGAKTPARMTESIGQEKPAATSFRQPEQARQPQVPQVPQVPPQEVRQQQTFRQEIPTETTRQAPKQSNGTPKAAATAQAFAGKPAGTDPDLSFSIPQQEGLVANLLTNLKNIGEIFKKGDYKAGSDNRFLLHEVPLTTRIARELGTTWDEFRRDPKTFAGEFVRGEGSNRYRRNALLAGSEMALVGYVTIYFISQMITSINRPNGLLINVFFIGAATYLAACYAARGFLLYKLVNKATGKLAVPKVALEFFNWAPLAAVLLLAVLLSNYSFYCRIFPGRCVQPEEEKVEEFSDVTMIDNSKMDIKVAESAKAKEKTLGGSKSKPKPASGGGGGGRNQPTPPSKGVPPQMALTPQIIPPNPEPPKIQNPSLVVASTIYGDPKVMPPMKGQIGDPTGVPAPPSSGPGSGDGIGRGKGQGVGGGDGGGLGPGRGGNTGGGDMGLGGGRSVEPMTAALRPTILYRERARYTEEARANKIQGTVVLSVVYTADGRISDIRVVRGLPDGLSESAIEAAKKIRFRPAVKNGAPVSVRGNIEFNFTLY